MCYDKIIRHGNVFAFKKFILGDIFMYTSVIGYPRVGSLRELKFATEKYFRKEISDKQLQNVAIEIRKEAWITQKNSGIDFIPSNDFSFYDNMLDTATLFNIIPKRYSSLKLPALDMYFAMARGYQGEAGDVKALAMKKWFNTNYHYMVPEIEDETEIYEENKIEDLLFIPKESYTFEEIREKFFKRLIKQNRFNQKSDFYFPIQFIGQYFNKTGDKKYFEDIINKQIRNIQFFYDKDQHDLIKNLKELSISEDGRVFINGNAILSEDSKNNYIPFEINEISEINIDHKKSMDSILRELKGEDFGQLVKITKALNERIKKRNDKKLAKKGTILSDDIDFRNSIDKTELKREFEHIINKMELQLMHKKYNNYKRNKV